MNLLPSISIPLILPLFGLVPAATAQSATGDLTRMDRIGAHRTDDRQADAGPARMQRRSDDGRPGRVDGGPDDGTRMDGIRARDARPLAISTYRTGDAGFFLRIDGGRPGDVAVLVAGFAGADLALPLGLRLGVRPDLVLPVGVLSSEGSLRVPIDLRRLAAAGPMQMQRAQNLWVQAIAVRAQAPLDDRFRATRARRVDLDLEMLDFEIDARLHQEGGVWFLAVGVRVPTSGFALNYDGTRLDADHEAAGILLRLIAPAAGELVVPVVQTVDGDFELGAQTGPRLDIVLKLERRGAGAAAGFRRTRDRATR